MNEFKKLNDNEIERLEHVLVTEIFSNFDDELNKHFFSPTDCVFPLHVNTFIFAEYYSDGTIIICKRILHDHKGNEHVIVNIYKRV